MTTTPAPFTLFALLYGDYPELAERCLRSLRDLCSVPGYAGQVRLGLNEVSPRVRQIVRRYEDLGVLPDLRLDISETNRKKYPVMRRLFYQAPVQSPLAMWFDDDSAIEPDLTEAQLEAWWESLIAALTRPARVAMAGHIYTMPFRGEQQAFIRRQAWYTGKPWYVRADRGPRMKFVTGGWWAAHMAVLRRLDYPWPDLHHRGGDTMLGEALRQQGYDLCSFRDHLLINADSSGRSGSSPRRGHDEAPYGAEERKQEYPG